jgi:hypothetical protein
VDLRHLIRLALLPALAVLVGALALAGRGSAQQRATGETAQGQTIRLQVVAGDLRSVQTRVRLHCTDGRVWDVAWSPSSGIERRGRSVSVLQVDRGAHLTARLDGEIGSRPHGTLRAIGSSNGVRCDSGAVAWAA